ncbi:uncharacterized protein A1O5_10279, partial [Cladophialophora psammophila CBS 110553]
LRQGSAEELALVGTDVMDRKRDSNCYSPPDPLGIVELSRVLRENSGFHATGPLDFVYGVVLMISKACILPIDYTKSVCEIFQDAARYPIDRDGRLDILLHA